MKPRCSKQRNHALTLVEVLAIIATVAILAAMLLPANDGKRKAVIISCANNLKQAGLAYKVWAGDHNDKYPMDIALTNGGTMELINTTEAWKTFQVMSNELITPKVVFCYGDSSRNICATNFGEDLKNKISYFIGLNAAGTNATGLLSGDDNFLLNQVPVKPGLLNVASNAPIEWDTTRHGYSIQRGLFSRKKVGNGNLLLNDGSLQIATRLNLIQQFNQTGFATNCLAIP